MSRPVKHFYEFGPFRVDVANRLLLRDGEPVPLTIKAFDTLLALVENRGQVLEKDELMKRVWPDTIVEENNLTQNVSALRKIIGEDASGRRYIETLPRRGYRFAGSVREASDDVAELIVEKSSRSHVVIEQESETSEPEPRPILPAGRPSRQLTLLPVVAACVVIAGIAAVVMLSRRLTSSPTSIAVLPFKPLVAAAKDEYLERGMADALIIKLSNIRQIVVRPTSSVLKYAEGTQDAVTAGRELGVESVLDGSIQRAGDKVRITVRLLRVSDGVSLWADKFDEDFTNIFSVQDSISQRMADVLTVKLTGEERKSLAKRFTENTDAYQAYIKGRFHLSKWNGVALQKATEYFKEAIDKDPNYALAYSGLADTYVVLGYLNIWKPREAFPKSEEAAKRALRMDDTLSEAHASLAKVHFFYDWDWSGFQREASRSLELDPNYSNLHGMYGSYFMAMGRFDEAIRERKRAQELDPLTAFSTISVGWAYFYAHRYDEAIEWYQKAIELDPNFALAHNDLATVYDKKGMYPQAFEEFLVARALSGAIPERIAELKQSYAESGMKGFWQKELEVAKEQMKQGRVWPHGLARIYTCLGDKDQAFKWLETAYDERESQMVFLNTTPVFESLHSDPRFAPLIERIGLSQ